MAKYEFWLTDDSGQRITLLKNAAFMSMSRTLLGYGTFHIGLPFRDFKVFPAFQVDRRVEVWRSPAHGATSRREGSFFLRKYNVYTRDEDGVEIIEFYGRSPIDILRRQAVTSTTAANYSKTDFIDDMMKAIVRENFISPAQTAPSGEFSCDGDESLGPTVSHTFFAQNVLDVLKDLRDMSISLNKIGDDDMRIYFDVVEGNPLSNGGFGYTFRTYAGLRGTDRTDGVIFSLENGNLKSPSYFEDHLDSTTVASILNLTTPALNGSATSPDAKLSRWNSIVSAQQSSEATVALNNAKAAALLREGEADLALNVTFVDSPGSDVQPRSLYGVDWDLGDLLPVRYAGKDFNAEVEIVYVSVNEKGDENIVGISSPRVITPSVPPYEVEYLVVAGGGGGGGSGGGTRRTGGGGAGGMLTASGFSVTLGQGYAVVVGAGGAGGVGANNGSAGGVSSFDTISTLGGGGGGLPSASGSSGGSGGGGGDNVGAGAGSDDPAQGNSGSVGGAANVSAGGGGGKGGAGGLPTAGLGQSSSITGAAVTYAAGGKGGDGGAGVAGPANTGNGGGGRLSSGNGFAGGSGIVVIRHLTISNPSATGGTITFDGAYTVHTFTSSGTFVA